MCSDEGPLIVLRFEPRFLWPDRPFVLYTDCCEDSSVKAQVYGRCPSRSDPAYYGATYTHMNVVWITAPPGWVYIGINPLPVGTVKRRYFSC